MVLPGQHRTKFSRREPVVTRSSDQTGAHVLALASNALTHDTRILKQIGSLSRAGYRVSALAMGGAEPSAHDLSDPARHIYRFASGDLMQDPRPDSAGAASGMYAGAVGAAIDRFFEAHRDVEDIRQGLRLKRLVTGLHWSGAVRRARRRHHRDLRTRIATLIQDSTAGPERLLVAAGYDAAMRRFTAQAPEWAARLEQAGPPRVVHAHDLYTLGAGIALAERHGARLIYDAHEYEPERMPPLPHAQKQAIVAFEDYALARADATITVSDGIAGFYRRRHSGLDVRLVMNCPEVRAHGKDADAVPGLRARMGLSPEVPLAAFIGLPTLGGRGLQVVFDALKICPEIHLAILGPRRAELDDALTAALAQMGLSDRVHLLEPVRPHQVVAAIGEADLSLCLIQDHSLSYRHAMPNKLFEALMAGVPTLVSDLPDMAALIREHRAGMVVDQTDATAVANAMQQILADRAAFVPASDAREALAQECSWEGQEAVLLQLYEDLLSETDSSRS